MINQNKQLDLFDLIDDIKGPINRCEICKQPSETNLCSDKCADAWFEMIFDKKEENERLHKNT